MNPLSLFKQSLSDSSSQQSCRLEVFHVKRQERPIFSDESSFKWIVVEEGKGSLQIETKQIQAESGDLFLIAPGQKYNLSQLAETQFWFVCYQCDLDMLTSSYQDNDLFILQLDKFCILSLIKNNMIRGNHFQLTAIEHIRWLHRLQQLKTELEEQSLGFVEMLNTLLVQMFMDTARLLIPKTEQSPVQSHPLLLKVFRIIEENYDQCQFSLSDVAKGVRRSPAYLTDFVRRKTGRTIVSWIIEYRMKTARRLLETTALPVSQIAEQVGYKDTNYFIRQFRQLHAITPKMWRDNNRVILSA